MTRRKVRKKDKRKQQDIARERIEILFGLADNAALKGEMDLADSYVELARKIGMKFNVRISREYKRKFCKYCYHYLMPGKTSRSRINSREKRVEVECFHCKRKMFFPYVREVKEKRRKKIEVQRCTT